MKLNAGDIFDVLLGYFAMGAGVAVLMGWYHPDSQYVAALAFIGVGVASVNRGRKADK